MIRRIIQMLCIILFYNISLQAQSVSKNNTIPDFIDYNCIEQFHEQVYLHLSGWSIVAGERLYFKAYLLGKKTNVQNLSKVLYIELLDGHNKIKANTRSNIDSGFCKSSIAIPDSLTTGLYKVIAYTNLMRNFPVSSYLHSSLIIIGMKNKSVNNTTSNHSPIDINIMTYETDQTLSQNRIPTMILNGILDKQVYSIREKVVLKLDIKDEDGKPLNGSFSVSVYEKLPKSYSNLNNDIFIVSSVFKGDSFTKNIYASKEYNDVLLGRSKYLEWLENVKNQAISFPYKSENRAFLLEGTLFDKSSQKAVQGKTIFLSTPDSFANLKYNVTDSSGRFIFALDRRYDNRKVFLNINNNSDSKEYYYVLDNKQIIDSAGSYEALKIDSLMNEFILRSKKIAWTNKVYYKSRSLQNNNMPINKHIHFYGNPDYSIRLSDYTQFEDFNDISNNILPNIAFKKKKDSFSIYSGNLIFQSFPNQNCLVLLNNIPFYNYEYLSKLGSRQIDHIDVNYNYLVYGNLNVPGVLSVYTKDKIIISNKHTLIFENKVENLSVAYETNKMNFEKLPDFKQILFWEPDVVFDKNGDAKIEFNASDLETEYVIDIEGLTSNGIPVSKKIEFKVQ